MATRFKSTALCRPVAILMLMAQRQQVHPGPALGCSSITSHTPPGCGCRTPTPAQHQHVHLQVQPCNSSLSGCSRPDTPCTEHEPAPGDHQAQAQTVQVGVVVFDDVVGQLAHEGHLLPASRGWQLEGPEAHKGLRHSAHHGPRLHLDVAAAEHPSRQSGGAGNSASLLHGPVRGRTGSHRPPSRFTDAAILCAHQLAHDPLVEFPGDPCMALPHASGCPSSRAGLSSFAEEVPFPPSTWQGTCAGLDLWTI